MSDEAEKQSEIVSDLSTASPPSPVNSTKPATGTFSSTIIPVRMEDISGEHGLVREFDQFLNLPYFPQPKPEFLPTDVVRILLGRTPLLVYRERKGQYTCIGNVRIYRMARLAFEPSELVPTISYSGSLTKIRRERLWEGLLIETFLLPAVFGRRGAELSALNAAWEKTSAAGLPDFWKGIGGFAEMYREATEPYKRKRG